MSASFPTSVKSFTTKLAGDTINAAHVNDIQDEVVAVEQDLINGLSRLRLASSTLTIASDAITVTKSLHAVDTESAAASDVLSTITAGTGVGAGHLLTLYAANAARVVTVTDATGNLQLFGGDCILGSAKKSILLRYDGTNWVEIARAGSAARVTTITSSATPTINTDTCDAVTITALAAAITSFTTNLSGTPTNFQKLLIRIKDNGTARAITWGASFEAKGTALPTTTVLSKVLTVGFLYDTVTSKWGCVAAVQEG